MKVFVSTAFENRGVASEVMKLFAAAGHTVTHDWTGESVDGLVGKAREEYLVRCALEDRKGVKEADVLVLLTHPNCKGAFVEVGIAIAHDIPVVVVNRERAEQVFYALPNHYFVDSPAAAVELVGKLEERDAKLFGTSVSSETMLPVTETPATTVPPETGELSLVS